MTAHPYDLVIGLDRSDQKADLCLIDPHTGQRRSVISLAHPKPCGNGCWNSRSNIPAPRVGLCLEQPAVHLIPFLETYDWITLHLINPITLQKYRKAFVTSRAKDNTKSAEYLADRQLTHHTKLSVWAPEDGATRAVQLSLGRGGRTHWPEQPADRPVETVFSAGPHAVWRGSVALVGHGVPV